LLVGDLLHADIPGRYDVVVLPDIIEHIPLEVHRDVFKRVAAWVSDSGFVLLHYPNPHYLAWCRSREGAKLQIIDQPVHLDMLLANAYPHGLYLDYFERYSIWVREGDYVVAVLRPEAGIGTFTDLPEPAPTLAARARHHVSRLRGRMIGSRSGS
jgi:hypothetical protein